jgi:hypothetical protein
MINARKYRQALCRDLRLEPIHRLCSECSPPRAQTANVDHVCSLSRVWCPLWVMSGRAEVIDDKKRPEAEPQVVYDQTENRLCRGL